MNDASHSQMQPKPDHNAVISELERKIGVIEGISLQGYDYFLEY